MESNTEARVQRAIKEIEASRQRAAELEGRRKQLMAQLHDLGADTIPAAQKLLAKAEEAMQSTENALLDLLDKIEGDSQ